MHKTLHTTYTPAIYATLNDTDETGCEVSGDTGLVVQPKTKNNRVYMGNASRNLRKRKRQQSLSLCYICREMAIINQRLLGLFLRTHGEWI